MAKNRSLYIGMDVGSTTVKAVVVNPETDEILWQDYQRHETRQPEKVLEFLKRIANDIGLSHEAYRLFITGSGGSNIAGHIHAKFVQEVTAVSLAVEKLHPEVGSVIELGGQDAKIIIFKEDPETGKKKKIPSMNDKCAGGTGAVIDKINAKLKIPPDELCNQGYVGKKLHPVAGKCGVFAETDINGLQKQGVPNDELMASLFESIIQQNLSVLTRGNTLRPEVLLLGGPNCYIRGMHECWQENIPVIWEERKFPLPEGRDPKSLIKVPNNAQYFAALGAVEFGKQEDPDTGFYAGFEQLERYITVDRKSEKKNSGSKGLVKSESELNEFRERYKRKSFVPKTICPGETVEAFMGIDGGSTSTKAVLLDRDRKLILKSYQLSRGNPIEDMMDMFAQLRKGVESQGASLKILGVGTTGYAKDVLKDTINADVALVETVAHMQASLHFYKNVDVICDVGGQDIKIIMLKNGQVKDFKLNTQCSAGNGYFLQSTAMGFGHKVEDYADIAFQAEQMPEFGYGCAVFMQSDIVNFQRLGWKAEEIMAGLAAVLPKNIWLYVSQIPNLAKLGKTFVLQGGTQYNLAAVKAQVDFIESRFKGKDEKPKVIVHEHCGESGAIGAALETARLFENGRETTFIGLDAVAAIKFRTARNEDTRCYFCKNKCLRTFIDVHTGTATHHHPPVTFDFKSGPEQTRSARLRDDVTQNPPSNGNGIDRPQEAFAGEAGHTEGNGKKNGKAEKKFKSKVPLQEGETRLIIATCEKGTVEDVNDMRGIKKEIDEICKANPNLVEEAAKNVFRSYNPESVMEKQKIAITPGQKRRRRLVALRKELKIGIPRVLNMYSMTPLFSAYFESLGILPENLIYSDFTSEELYKEGAKRGSIDPCFPSKLGIPHVHNLLYRKHPKYNLNLIFFPMIDNLMSPLKGIQDSRACPTVTATPEAVKAAFTKEGNLFKEMGIRYLDTFVNPKDPVLFERQMLRQFEDILGLTGKENKRAVEAGFKALNEFQDSMFDRAREILKKLEEEDKIGIVVLGRPYHNDPGINHEILIEFQKLGYPVFTQDSLPTDPATVMPLFKKDIDEGLISDPMEIKDVWKNAYSENTNRKVWAAKFTARHPNLVAMELSNFKCGHDAPIYTVVEEIIENSGTPYFSFKDIDENKPSGAIKIRVETIAYFLKRYREKIIDRKRKKAQYETRIREYQRELWDRYGNEAGEREKGPAESVLVSVG